MANNKQQSLYIQAVNQRIRNDRIFLNNPVVMQGLGLAPIVIADTSGQNALILIVSLFLLMVPSRLLTVLVLHVTGNRGRGFLYSIIASIIYIPIYLVLSAIFGSNLLLLGIYLPVLVADPLINSQGERSRLEDPIDAAKQGVSTAAGAALMVLLMGVLREFLATGAVFGYPLYHGSTNLMPLANQPAGGFILMGLVCAVWRSLASAHRQSISMEVRPK